MVNVNNYEVELLPIHWISWQILHAAIALQDDLNCEWHDPSIHWRLWLKLSLMRDFPSGSLHWIILYPSSLCVSSTRHHYWLYLDSWTSQIIRNLTYKSRIHCTFCKSKTLQHLADFPWLLMIFLSFWWWCADRMPGSARWQRRELISRQFLELSQFDD